MYNTNRVNVKLSSRCC